MLPVVGLFKTWHWIVGCLSFYKSPTASSSKHSWQCRPSYPSLLAPCRKHQKYIAQILLASYFSMPGVLLAQGATAANTAHAPSFDTAANGVPIVNINAPSAKGVSRNEYDQFNVDAKGLILNNSTSIVQTQLAGYVDGNKHLGGKSASIILNEVMGNSRSALNGYMEIAGQRAQLIIANQHGITCNGCGFINTSRGMLTTGASVFDAFGNLSGFDVSRGDVNITGLGFNDTDTDEVDILARSVSLNADMWANQATIITGDNVINYNDKSVTSRSTGEKTGFSLDVAAIGGMYANRIRLIGTEKGLGVNLSGKVSGTESMVLDTQGNLVNKVSLSSKQLSVNANNITNTGDLLGDKIILTANDLENTGSKANIQASNTMNITLQGTLNNQDSAKIQTPNGLLTLNANLVNNQSTLAANQLTLIATQLDNHTKNGSIFGTDKVDLTLTGALNNRDSALIQSDKQLVIHADGNITNRNATLGSMGAVTISSQNLTNRGTVSAQNDTLSVTSDSVNNNGGLAGTRVTINANDINNTGSHAFVLAKEKFEIVSTGGLNNTDGGVFYSLGDGEFDVAGILTNSSATIETHNDLTIKASKVSNRKRAFSASESVSSQAYNNVGIGVPGGYYQASRSYTQTTTTPYIATDSPQAYLLSGGDMTITGAIDNLYSTVSAVGNLNFTASQLNNQFYRANKTIVSSGVDTLYRNETYCKRKVGGHCISERQRTKIDTRGYNNTSASTVTLASSTFTAGGNITGKVGFVDNKGKVGEVEKAIASKDPLPSASDEVNDNTLRNMRSSRAARLNILKSPMAVSNVAGLSLFYH